MHRVAARADFFDASALVKVFSPEPRSDVVQAYFHLRTTKYTSPFCFYEALNILKSKWKYKAQLSKDDYFAACNELIYWYGAASRKIKDVELADPVIQSQTVALARRFEIDLSDAFQIMSVKHGYFSRLARDSKTVLVTADAALADAARSLDLRVWDVMNEPPPT